MSTGSSRDVPGGIRFAGGDIMLNEGRETIELDVTNTGDRAIQVGSHFHFFESNRALAFDRERAFGMRLDVPSGTAVRFEAGQTHRVTLVPFGGRQRLFGFNGLTRGGALSQARPRAIERGFMTDEGEQE